MKEGFDKEIDSLLRRRARGTAEPRLWGDGAGDGGSNSAHLDADELGAFAEGALPAPARLAAASHLADCGRCRGVVVGLARVVDAGAEAKHPAIAAAAGSSRPSAWRELIASLFSPRAIRFAVPVLALSLVGVVSYIALRSDKSGALQAAREGRSSNVSMQQETSAPAAANASNANVNPSGLIDLNANANANAAPTAEPAQNSQAVTNRGHGVAGEQPAVAADADKAEAQPSAAAPPPPPPAAAAPAEGPVEVSKAAPKTATTEVDEVAQNGSRERAENRDRAAGSDARGDDTSTSDLAMRQRNAAQSRAANEVQMPDGGSRNQSQKRAADNNASGGYVGGGSAGASAAPKESERGASRSGTFANGRTATRRAEKKAEENEDAPAGDMRNAAGHRFRREGGAWVDVNYKSSMPSTGVRRGTEGFRALVADVPEVGRVAEAIGGEVVVVVKGHAYRIR